MKEINHSYKNEKGLVPVQSLEAHQIKPLEKSCIHYLSERIVFVFCDRNRYEPEQPEKSKTNAKATEKIDHQSMDSGTAERYWGTKASKSKRAPNTIGEKAS